MSDVIFKTSGSTGAAKEIVRSEESLLSDARSLVKAFPDVWAGTPEVVSSVPTNHMYGALWRVRAPFVAGCRVNPAVLLSVEELMEASRGVDRAVFVTTPSFLEKALLHPDFAHLKGRLTAIVTAGSELREGTALAVADVVGVCPLEIFGSTETGTVAWRRRTEGDEWTLVEGVSARLADGGGLEVDSPFAMSRPYVMSDGVEFTATNRFRLRGRLDRRVKILEEFVSLPAVEAALEALPLVAQARVEAYGADVPRLGAVLVLTERGVNVLRRSTYAELSGQIRRDLFATLPGIAVPRRFRFVRELPVNERGKTAAGDVRAILSANWQEPVVFDWTLAPGELSTNLVFPPDSECFRGHFPGFPILPGVAQLFYVCHFARQVFHDFPMTQTYRRLKFQKVVFPADVIRLTVARRSEGGFSFALVGGHDPCASGLIEETCR